jgi:Zn-finger nucleic acid-binding protein
METLHLLCPNCNNEFTYNKFKKVYECEMCGSTTIVNYDRKVLSNLEKSIAKLKLYVDKGHYYQAHNIAVELLNLYPENEYIKTVIKMTEEANVLRDKEKQYEAVKKRVHYLNDVLDHKVKYNSKYYCSLSENISIVRTYALAYPEDEEIHELYERLKVVQNNPMLMQDPIVFKFFIITMGIVLLALLYIFLGMFGFIY